MFVKGPVAVLESSTMRRFEEGLKQGVKGPRGRGVSWRPGKEGGGVLDRSMTSRKPT